MKTALIDKYLEGLTSPEEERTLARLLEAIPKAERTETEEALLLMLTAIPRTDEEDLFTADYTEEYDRIVRQRKRRVLWRYTGIAAAVALLLTMGFLFHTPTEENIAVAYINGQEVNNEQQVMAMMENTMSDLFAHSNTEEELYQLFNPE